MENPVVDFCVGCHVWPGIPEGTVGVRTGPFMAAMDRFDITILGRGGHGAMPHLSVDALDVGVQTVSALQRLVSRQMDPLEPAVVTVGSFFAGNAYNVIAETARLSGTTRTFNPEVWQSWSERIERVTAGVCASMGADFELNFTRGHPPVINDPFVADVVRSAATETVGRDRVVDPPPGHGRRGFFLLPGKGKGVLFRPRRRPRKRFSPAPSGF